MPIPTPADVVLSDPVFDGCRLKLARAHEHLETIKNEIRAWSNSHPYRLVTESSADAKCHSLVIYIDNPPPLRHLSAVAADCFHNLRTVLDQFVYAAAILESGQNPPLNERNLQFPICECSKSFRDAKGCIKGLSGSVRAAIRGVQPYNRMHDKLPPLLWLLRDLDNADKHRLPKVVLDKVTGMNFGDITCGVKITGLTPLPRPQTVQNFLYRNRFDRIYNGAKLMTFVFEGPEPNVKINGEMTIQIAIDHPTGPNGATLTTLFSFTETLVREVEAVVREIASAIKKP